MTIASENLHAAYDQLRHHCAMAAPSPPDLLELLGDDRQRFLNGQVTCDVASLQPGTGVYGFFTTAKGQVQADVSVLALEDRLWLLLPTGLGSEIRERLEKYIIVDRVEVRAVDDWHTRTLVGPESADVMRRLFSVAPPEQPWAHAGVEIEGASARLVREGRLGVEALTLWFPAPAAAVVDAALMAEGLDEVSVELLEAVRLEAGEPRFGVDFGPQNLPQETGIEGAVSYTKGCYLGQEIVARLHYRGQVSRQLCGLVFEGLPDDQLPAVDTEVLLEGRSAGTVRSTAVSPKLGQVIGLGLLQRRAFEPGTRVELDGGGSAQVRELPPV